MAVGFSRILNISFRSIVCAEIPPMKEAGEIIESVGC